MRAWSWPQIQLGWYSLAVSVATVMADCWPKIPGQVAEWENSMPLTVTWQRGPISSANNRSITVDWNSLPSYAKHQESVPVSVLLSRWHMCLVEWVYPRRKESARYSRFGSQKSHFGYFKFPYAVMMFGPCQKGKNIYRCWNLILMILLPRGVFGYFVRGSS